MKNFTAWCGLRKLPRFILGMFGFKYDSGTLVLVVSGQKQIKVSLPFIPKNVWINPLEPEGIQTCHAEPDSFDIRLLPDGFVLLVKLGSEYREIEWVATN